MVIALSKRLLLSQNEHERSQSNREYAQSNKEAEIPVQTIKTLLRKPTDLSVALLTYCTSPLK